MGGTIPRQGVLGGIRKNVSLERTIRQYCSRVSALVLSSRFLPSLPAFSLCPGFPQSVADYDVEA